MTDMIEEDEREWTKTIDDTSKQSFALLRSQSYSLYLVHAIKCGSVVDMLSEIRGLIPRFYLTHTEVTQDMRRFQVSPDEAMVEFVNMVLDARVKATSLVNGPWGPVPYGDADRANEKYLQLSEMGFLSGDNWDDPKLQWGR